MITGGTVAKGGQVYRLFIASSVMLGLQIITIGMMSLVASLGK